MMGRGIRGSTMAAGKEIIVKKKKFRRGGNNRKEIMKIGKIRSFWRNIYRRHLRN